MVWAATTFKYIFDTRPSAAQYDIVQPSPTYGGAPRHVSEVLSHRSRAHGR
jgi:hypothetical protein